MNGLLIALIVLVPVASVVTVLVVRRTLSGHQTMIGKTVDRHARDTALAWGSAEREIKRHVADELKAVRDDVQSLSAAVRARLLADVPAVKDGVVPRTRGRRAPAAPEPSVPAAAPAVPPATPATGKGDNT